MYDQIVTEYRSQRREIFLSIGEWKSLMTKEEWEAYIIQTSG